MKKFYSLLILPLIAVFCLFGCGTDRTTTEIKAVYSQMVDTYVINSESNWYFEKPANSTEYTKMYVTYDNEYGFNDAVLGKFESSVSDDLGLRYKQLTSVYARTLLMAYNYYTNWNELFFANIDSKNPDADDLTELYDKLVDFRRQLEKFNTSKLNIEREVKLLGINSELVAAKIDAFNNEYNNLISKVLNFVNYFKDLHVKYFYSDTDVVDGSYAKRAYDEAILSLANFIYKDYLQALTKNGTVQLISIDNAISSSYNIFNDKRLLTFVHVETDLSNLDNPNSEKINIHGIELIKDPLISALNDPSNEKNKSAVSAVNQFVVSLNTFNQYFNLYNKVYDKVSMESFNNYRFEINGGFEGSNATVKHENYIETLSPVDAANVNVLIDFEENKVSAFLSSINTLLLLSETF